MYLERDKKQRKERRNERKKKKKKEGRRYSNTEDIRHANIGRKGRYHSLSHKVG